MVRKKNFHVPVSYPPDSKGRIKELLLGAWPFFAYFVSGEMLLTLVQNLSGYLDGILIYGYIAILVAAISVFSVTRPALRASRIGQALHWAFHSFRDSSTLVLAEVQNAKNAEGKPDEAARREVLMQKTKLFEQNFTDKTAAYFSHLLNDPSIGCSIRRSTLGEARRVYGTVAWSSNLDATREEHSVGIPYDQGIPQQLRSKNNAGVYVVNSIKQAKSDNLWVSAPSDDFADIRKVMVAPVSGYVEGEKSLLGLLIISSAKNDFRAQHAGHLLGFADYLGHMYPLITFL